MTRGSFRVFKMLKMFKVFGLLRKTYSDLVNRTM
jgi:hypothetical protein